MKKCIATLSLALFGALTSHAQVILQQDFEGVTTPALPGTWSQTTAATTGWKTNTGSIISNGKWVLSPHTKYAVIDDWNNNENNNPTTLKSPIFSLVGVTGAYLYYDFYYIGAYWNGGNKESAFVQISTDGGANWTNLDSVIGKASEWQSKFISLAAYNNMPNLMIGFKYSDNATNFTGTVKQLPGMAVDNIKIFAPVSADAALTSVSPALGSPTAYGVAGASVTLGGTLLNYGSSTITSLTVKYQQGANPVVSNSITGLSIAKFATGSFSCTVPYTMPTTTGDYPVKLWIELPGDAVNSDDTGTTTLTAVAFKPAKRILVEEGTGTWCGWCPRGAVYMDSLWNNYQSAISPVAVHNGDPMVVSAYDSYIGTKISGYPSVVVDRDEIGDPSGLIDIYNKRKDYFSFAEITMADQGAPSFGFSVKVSVKPAVDLSGDYRLALALTESDVKGQSDGSTWDQHNYYSFQTSNIPLVGAGHNWQLENDPIKGTSMSYNFVARAILPDPNGAAGSLPSSMTAGTTYDYTFTTIIPQPYKRANMKAVAMLIRASDGKVLNSNVMQVPVGVTNVEAGVQQLSVYPNPAYDMANLVFNLAETSNVTVQVFDAVGRVVYTAGEKTYQQGAQRISINTASLASGIYTVKLQTEKGAVTQQLSVAK